MADHNWTLTLGDDAATAGESSAQPSLCLVLRCNELLSPPRRFALSGIDALVIGRGEVLETAESHGPEGRCLRLTLPDRHVSTQHARVFRSAGGWAIEDTGSKNGTMLNGLPCMRAPLGDGDVLEVGCAFFLFEAVAPDPAAASPGAGGGGGEVETTLAAAAPAFATLSPALAATHARLAAIARSTLPVLLLGESGVGKEVTARTVHELSGRSGPFVAVNCGAIAPTLVESTLFGHKRGAFTGAVDHQPGVVRSAHQGTLLLDEVGELSAPAQAALLRVLQEGEVVAVGETRAVSVDVRIIAATNRDVRAAAESGAFRRDLLARLAGMTVQLPTLRERRADLGILIAALLRRLAPDAAAVTLSARAARALIEYDWPLNVRELEMCLRAAGELARWQKIELEHLPEEVRVQASTTEEDEREAAAGPSDERRAALVAQLTAHGGNLAAVARALGTSRTQVHRLIKKYGLRLESYRRS
jgi:transcriptional regulator with AAA-type ATPase domain